MTVAELFEMSHSLGNDGVQLLVKLSPPPLLNAVNLCKHACIVQ